MTLITGNKINSYRALTLRSALKLEVLGMKRHGRSAYSIVKAEYKLKGNKKSVYEQFDALLVEELGAIPRPLKEGC